jgi:hypothetical protein
MTSATPRPNGERKTKTWHVLAFIVVTATLYYYAKVPVLIAAIVFFVMGWS